MWNVQEIKNVMLSTGWLWQKTWTASISSHMGYNCVPESAFGGATKINWDKSRMPTNAWTDRLHFR